MDVDSSFLCDLYSRNEDELRTVASRANARSFARREERNQQKSTFRWTWAKSAAAKWGKPRAISARRVDFNFAQGATAKQREKSLSERLALRAAPEPERARVSVGDVREKDEDRLVDRDFLLGLASRLSVENLSASPRMRISPRPRRDASLKNLKTIWKR